MMTTRLITVMFNSVGCAFVFILTICCDNSKRVINPSPLAVDSLTNFAAHLESETDGSEFSGFSRETIAKYAQAFRLGGFTVGWYRLSDRDWGVEVVSRLDNGELWMVQMDSQKHRRYRIIQVTDLSGLLSTSENRFVFESMDPHTNQ
jgi:hypothetical protein